MTVSLSSLSQWLIDWKTPISLLLIVGITAYLTWLTRQRAVGDSGSGYCLAYPIYYRVIRRIGHDWHFNQTQVLYNPNNVAINVDRIEERYGLTMEKVVLELFHINGGKTGYYLANLRNQQYWYCGKTEAGIRSKLLELGIGRADPAGNG